MIRKSPSNRIAGLVLLTGIAWFGPATAEDDDWQFDLALYGWLPQIDVTLPSGNKSKITRSDIVDNLDMTFMGRVRAQKNKWSLTTDVIYFDLVHKDKGLERPNIQLGKLGLEAALIKPTVGYRVLESEQNQVEVYAGGRYFWMKPTLRLNTLAPLPPASFQESESDSRWDALVGVRAQHEISSRWYAASYFDIGTGESDYVVDLFAGAGYRFKRLDVLAAWRYMKYDFGNDWVLQDMTVNGPLVGVEFSFGSNGTH